MSLVIVSLIYGFYIEFEKGFFSFEKVLELCSI